MYIWTWKTDVSPCVEFVAESGSRTDYIAAYIGSHLRIKRTIWKCTILYGKPVLSALPKLEIPQGICVVINAKENITMNLHVSGSTNPQKNFGVPYIHRASAFILSSKVNLTITSWPWLLSTHFKRDINHTEIFNMNIGITIDNMNNFWTGIKLLAQYILINKTDTTPVYSFWGFIMSQYFY